MGKIYTKVGDKGETSLVGGQKLPKDDLRLEAYGTVDELNCALGSVRAALEKEIKAESAAGGPASEGTDSVAALAKLDADLETLQHWLFDLGSLLAALPEDREKYRLPPLTKQQIKWLEDRIDGATALIKPLHCFILPAGCEAACRLHVARTVARRAERSMVRVREELPENSVPFVNRLSDYLFVMARYCNHLLDINDVPWRHRKAI